jgi:phosphatidylinositol glycan class B
MSRLPFTSCFLLVFCLRLLIALSTRGFFQPDEYFQALEPAHRAVFGFGHLTWEWTADPPIRSFIFPALFTPGYALVKIMQLEHTRFLVGRIESIFLTMFSSNGQT